MIGNRRAIKKLRHRRSIEREKKRSKDRALRNSSENRNRWRIMRINRNRLSTVS
jgi:hypothetical protein